MKKWTVSFFAPNVFCIAKDKNVWPIPTIRDRSVIANTTYSPMVIQRNTELARALHRQIWLKESQLITRNRITQSRHPSRNGAWTRAYQAILVESNLQRIILKFITYFVDVWFHHYYRILLAASAMRELNRVRNIAQLANIYITFFYGTPCVTGSVAQNFSSTGRNQHGGISLRMMSSVVKWSPL